MATEATSQVRARYVQVAVNAGRPTHMTFSYRVPPGREVEAGDVVHVPFGKRTLQGIVVEGPTGFSGYHGDIRDLDPPVEGAPRLNAPSSSNSHAGSRMSTSLRSGRRTR